jgi:hypothetical protein
MHISIMDTPTGVVWEKLWTHPCLKTEAS